MKAKIEWIVKLFNSVYFRLLTGIALLGILFFYLDINSLRQLLNSCQPKLLVLAWLALFGTILTGALSWKILLKSLGFRLDFWPSLKLTLAAYGLNNLLIGGFWGELYRLKAAQKYSIQPTAAAYAAIFELWASACALIVAASAALCFISCKLNNTLDTPLALATSTNIYIFIIFYLLTLTIVLCLGYYFFSDFIIYLYRSKDQFSIVHKHASIRHYIFQYIKIKTINIILKFGIKQDTIYHNIDFLIKNRKSIKRSLIAAIIINIFTSISEAISYVFLANAINIDTEFHQFLSTVPLFSILSWLPISLNGLGIQEVAALIVWQPFGFSQEAIITVSALNHIIKLTWAAFGVIIYILESCSKSLKIK